MFWPLATYYPANLLRRVTYIIKGQIIFCLPMPLHYGLSIFDGSSSSKQPCCHSTTHQKTLQCWQCQELCNHQLGSACMHSYENCFAGNALWSAKCFLALNLQDLAETKNLLSSSSVTHSQKPIIHWKIKLFFSRRCQYQYFHHSDTKIPAFN
jgi:hypothetical protein